MLREVGDAAKALSGAAKTVEATYWSEYCYHAQMEPMNAVASVAADGKSAEIWTGTQFGALISNLPGFDATLSYTTNDVLLNLIAQLGALPSDNLNRNQGAVAGVVCMGGAELLGQPEPVRVEVDRDDAGRAGHTGGHDRGQADRPCAEHGDGVGIGVLGGVDHGLSGGAQHGAESVVDVAVTDTDHFDGDAVFLLHFGGHPFQPGTDGGLGVGGSLVEPTAQGTFLDACQTLYLARVLRASLDEGECVQHGVVDVGGHLVALVEADAVLSLLGEVVGEPPPPRAGDERQAGAHRRRRHQRPAGAQAVMGGEEEAGAGLHQQRADHHLGQAQGHPGQDAPVGLVQLGLWRRHLTMIP